MKVLFLASEAAPLVQVGGLADVAGVLPKALRAAGIDVRLALPFHAVMARGSLAPHRVGEVVVQHISGPQEAEIFTAELSGLPVTLVDGEPVRAVPTVYGAALESGRKYAFFSLAAMEACRALGWRPDVLHANDWHSASAVVWLKRYRHLDAFWQGVPSLLTIHNLAYMGAGAEDAMLEYHLPPSEDPLLPAWARGLPLPMGLAAADWLSTVSPSYAEEILTPQYGFGLEGFLGLRAERLAGILNGLDEEAWDPSTDAALPARYSSDTLDLRAENKRRLQVEVGLPANPTWPLLAMISRLDQQKGVDLALETLESALDDPWQFVLLGTGDPEIEQRALRFAERHADRVKLVPRFDAPLARRLYAGSDMVLIPSRYEPCGLTQMIAMRYGSVPLARATGGLRDTVRERARGKGNGVVFARAHVDDLKQALRRAFALFSDADRWRTLQRQGMSQDFSWRRSVGQYRRLYQRLVREGPRPA